MNRSTGRDVPTVMEKALRLGLDSQRLIFRVTGAGLLIATGAIHLDLYLTGYRTIPTIGWLFLLQVITAFGLGATVLASGSRLASAAGAGFALSTLGGYLLSLRIGLFGFREVRTSVGIMAGIIEVVAFAVLAALALGSLAQHRPASQATHHSRLMQRLQACIPVARWASAAFAVLAAVLFGISLEAMGPAPTSAGSSRVLLKIAKIDGASVQPTLEASRFTGLSPILRPSRPATGPAPRIGRQ